MLWATLVVALVLGGWRFASHNAVAVPVDLLVTQLPETPLWLGLLAAFAGGAAAAGLLALYEITRLSLLTRRYRKAMVRLESEIHELRNLPLSADAAADPASAPTVPRPRAREG
jgi:uncharacterized integral membrane protein